ncbi:hypothetical protein F4813DRAFT_365002 [Daldinia decipiens]|uniref:uncharacterized protein n=1 Tax=Daldinia decipiens TaxID=326647 RepID=UPI0020C3DA44|nr:uncharacterized protein F4813DRAFT_365002 [Daldinia decipiens]KAI1656002.1 hypothetical protein F4813DRAFT_365002 [Daldinia decipiens]
MADSSNDSDSNIFPKEEEEEEESRLEESDSEVWSEPDEPEPGGEVGPGADSDLSVVTAVLRVRPNGAADPDHNLEQTILIALHPDFPGLSGDSERQNGDNKEGEPKDAGNADNTENASNVDNDGNAGNDGSRRRAAIVFHLFHNGESVSTTTWRTTHENYIPAETPDWEWRVSGEVDFTEVTPIRGSVLPEGRRLLPQEWLTRRFEGGAHIDTPQQPQNPVETTPTPAQNQGRENIKIIALICILLSMMIFWVSLLLPRITMAGNRRDAYS